MTLSTVFLLLAQYNGLAIIPIPVLCRDYLSHLSQDKFLRKVRAGEIEIPLIKMDASQNAAKGVHIQDLANYLDKQRKIALRELSQLS